MPQNGETSDNPSLKNPEMYEELRDQGASKEKAARISNAAAAEGKETVGSRGGQSPAYEEWTVEELSERAKELNLEGYSELRKDELIEELRNH